MIPKNTSPAQAEKGEVCGRAGWPALAGRIVLRDINAGLAIMHATALFA